MINILVVDDEPIAADGISIYLEEHGDAEWNIITAYNGLGALKCARQRIDILLADIRMPGMDGFEVQKKLQERWPLMKTIFLTGNGEIGLAQQAIRQGNTVDYVLKMEDETIVQEAVQKAAELMAEEERKLDAVKKAEQEMNEILPVLQKDLMLSLIRGQGPDEELAERFERLHMPLTARSKVLLLVVHLNENTHANDFAPGILENVLERYLWPIYRFAVVTVTERRIAVMIQSSRGSSKIDAQHVYSLLEMAQTPFSRAVGGAVFALNYDSCGWEEVSRHYRALALTIEKNMDEADDAMMMQGRTEELPESVSIQEMQMIRTCLEQRDYEQAGELCRRLPRPQTAGGRIDQYRYLLKVFSHAMNTRKNAEESYRNKPMPALKLSDEGWKQMIADFAMLFRSLGGTGTESGSKQDRLIEEICKYIDEHLKEDLSLAQMAEVTRHSAPYISRVFAEKKGVNYNNYVVERRLEKAREYLKDESCTVNEIVEKTGYRSASYFTHAFRDRYGLTPTEFRKAAESKKTKN